MTKLKQWIATGLTPAIVIVAIGSGAPAAAQSAGSYTSGSSYNPVQAAINRKSMNAVIIRQATGGKHRSVAHKATRRTSTRR